MFGWITSITNAVLDCLADWLGGLAFIWWLIDEVSKNTPNSEA